MAGRLRKQVVFCRGTVPTLPTALRSPGLALWAGKGTDPYPRHSRGGGGRGLTIQNGVLRIGALAEGPGRDRPPTPSFSPNLAPQ